MANAAVMGGGRGGRPAEAGKLTGRGVILWLGIAFGVMFAANFALIYIALSTLHGEELENPYDASQIYNQKLADARTQDQLGWTVNVSTRREGGGLRIVTDIRDRDGALASGLQVRARLIHPFDRAEDREASLVNYGGDYEGVATNVKGGRWAIEIEALRDGQRKFFSHNKIVVSDTAE